MIPPDFIQARRALKLSQGELATLLQVSRYTVSRWERGEARIPHMASVLMRALQDPDGGKRVSWLLMLLRAGAPTPAPT